METKSDAMLVEAILLRELSKKSEELSLIFLAYSISWVLYVDLDILVNEFSLYFSKKHATDLNFTTWFWKLHCISEEVKRNLLQSLGVDFHHLFTFIKLKEYELHVLVRSHDILSRQDFSQYLIDVNSLDVLYDFTWPYLG